MPKKIENVSQRILDATLKIYREEGFEKISMRRVADESGLAVGTLYNRFEDKDELLAQVLAGDIERIKTSMMETVFGKQAGEALKAVIHSFVNRAVNESHFIIEYVLDLQSQKEYMDKILKGASAQIKELVGELIIRVYEENGAPLGREEASFLADMAMSMMQTASHSGALSAGARAEMISGLLLPHAKDQVAAPGG